MCWDKLNQRVEVIVRLLFGGGIFIERLYVTLRMDVGTIYYIEEDLLILWYYVSKRSRE